MQTTNNTQPDLTTYEGRRTFRIELAKRAGYTLHAAVNGWFLRSLSGTHELPFDVNDMSIKESDIWASDYVYDHTPDWADSVDDAMLLLPEDTRVVMTYHPAVQEWSVIIGTNRTGSHEQLSTAICLAFWEYTNAVE